MLDTWSFSPTAIGPGPAGPRWKIRVLGTLDPAAYFFTQFYGSAFESDDAAYGAHESGSVDGICDHR